MKRREFLKKSIAAGFGLGVFSVVTPTKSECFEIAELSGGNMDEAAIDKLLDKLCGDLQGVFNAKPEIINNAHFNSLASKLHRQGENNFRQAAKTGLMKTMNRVPYW